MKELQLLLAPELVPRVSGTIVKATVEEEVWREIDEVLSGPLPQQEPAQRPVEKSAPAGLSLGLGGVGVFVIGALVLSLAQGAGEKLGPAHAPGLAVAATKESPFENSLGMRFVPVPVEGGGAEGEGVLFSVWETRILDYEAFVAETNLARPKPDFPQKDDHPVVNIRHADAVAFCDWLTGRERELGKIGPGEAYRLPSDHEWSCAVGIGRAEDSGASPEEKERGAEGYPWGRTYPPLAGAGNYYGAETVREPAGNQATALADYDDGFARTAPVGSFGANGLGLYDLGGNVWEWCEDWYYRDKEDRRVLRGASWGFHFESDLLSSSRYGVEPGYWNLDVGFRVVLAPVGG